MLHFALLQDFVPSDRGVTSNSDPRSPIQRLLKTKSRWRVRTNPSLSIKGKKTKQNKKNTFRWLIKISVSGPIVPLITWSQFGCSKQFKPWFPDSGVTPWNCSRPATTQSAKTFTITPKSSKWRQTGAGNDYPDPNVFVHFTLCSKNPAHWNKSSSSASNIGV